VTEQNCSLWNGGGKPTLWAKEPIHAVQQTTFAGCNLAGCSTGMSTGFVPRRFLST